MTWNHPRGYDPLAAAALEWEARTGERLTWDKRSLQDFETFPVEALAREYDLIVIDHPHVGQVAGEGCLAPLESLIDASVLAGIRAGTVGRSYESYTFEGHQWALPVDAATQVQAWVPGRVKAPARTWDEMMALAREGRVLCPLLPPHSLMSLYSLCGLEGIVPNVHGPDLFPKAAERAYDRLLALVKVIDPACFDYDPIKMFELMAETGSDVAVAPLIYGYVSYSLDGFRPTKIAFADMPVIGDAGPAGSALGGTGIAVSAYAKDKQAAAAFAAWICGGQAQRALYATSGGQAGHADAWEDKAINSTVADFYIATRETLEKAWVRPRHNGYMAFQSDGSDRLNQALKQGEDAGSVLSALNRMFAESLK